MTIDFSPLFEQYEALLKAADAIFEKVRNEYPACVKCEEGCSDCCHALFDLTLVEALYINHHFNRTHSDRLPEKEAIIDQANIADRQAYKIKKEAYKALESGMPEEGILADLAKKRSRCPLLNAQDLCSLYDHRPITCRFYGIPTAIGGRGHTCGRSAFEPGEPYPTVNLDLIQRRLYQISDELVKALKSRYVKMSEMLVPLSMALLTVYDDEYLGIHESTPEKGTDAEKGEGNE
ncbi:YkgJ family cysteine cluster protein [Desulfococcus sp.]|uniref:YkgJ family cysteine cluster protein n=1 Tax=Desulfococcus sp. TaxID=2025834 RepID=UPI003594442F